MPTATELFLGSNGFADPPVSVPLVLPPSRKSSAQPLRSSPLLESRSKAFRTALHLLEKTADSRAPVLLLGESGTGKGVLAEWVHGLSDRRHAEFVTVNCPALSEELLTAELFGHAKGAFTGAVRDKPGRVEAAHGGTLFLDEIGDLPPALQVKLLRFLQDGSFERVGDVRPRYADVRIIAATNRDPQADVEKGLLRLDLYYRLNLVEVVLPPLRERIEDLFELANHCLKQLAETSGRPVPELSEGARALLRAHRWPGNLRELKNELERAWLLHRGPVLDETCFSSRLSPAGSQAPYIGGPFTVAQIEREHIERVLATAPSYEAAAITLGIDDSTLWRKRKRFAATRASHSPGSDGLVIAQLDKMP